MSLKGSHYRYHDHDQVGGPGKAHNPKDQYNYGDWDKNQG